jgi:hypothetical protein
MAESYEREVRDLPWSDYRTTVVIELYRVRICPVACNAAAPSIELKCGFGSIGGDESIFSRS